MIMKFTFDTIHSRFTSLFYFASRIYNYTLHGKTYFPVHSIDYQLKRTFLCS